VRRVWGLVSVIGLCTALSATTTATGVGHDPNVRVRAGTSLNWSGYAVSGAPGSFGSVSGSWTQPSVTCGTQSSYSAFWVGLDGDTTSTVEQLGTEADCIGGVAQYSSWFEMYPHRSYATTITVLPEHTYHASVVSLGGGLFSLSLADVTTGAPPFTTIQRLPQAKLASAEAIAEAPSHGGALPLANFDIVRFSDVNVGSLPMSALPAEPITMVTKGGGIDAQPSGLIGGAFSVKWSPGT